LKISWTSQAADDLQSAYEYVSAESPDAAERLLEQVFSAIEILGQFPRLGREGRVLGTREFAITSTTFIVVYRLRHHQLELLSILHGARKWPEKL